MVRTTLVVASLSLVLASGPGGNAPAPRTVIAKQSGLPASVVGSVLFADDFSHGLTQWDVHGGEAVRIRESGDPARGAVLELVPNGDVLALMKGSDAWRGVRVEGRMLFPSANDNYLGLVYHAAHRAGRWDFGLVYVKGNNGYLQLNPHRDFNVSRTLYPEFRVPLTGDAAVETGRDVDYHGPRTVAYYRATIASPSARQAELAFGTVDDLAIWINGHFEGFVPRQDNAWFDVHVNPAHPGRRVPITLREGMNDVVVRVRGGVYASGGFFSRLIDAEGSQR